MAVIKGKVGEVWGGRQGRREERIKRDKKTEGKKEKGRLQYLSTHRGDEDFSRNIQFFDNQWDKSGNGRGNEEAGTRKGAVTG